MITLIKDATTIGLSEPFVVIQDKDEVNAVASVQVDFIGSPTALTLCIEGSVTGNAFTTIANHEVTAAELVDGIALFHIINKATPIIRANILTLTGGVSPEVSVYYNKGIS